MCDHGGVRDDATEVREGVAPGRLVYDCTPWAGETRRLLRAMLDNADIHNAWQGTELTILESDRDLVDELVDQALSTTMSAIDTGTASIVYEVGGWPSALQNEFVDQLTISEVAYEWDSDGNVVVSEDDEDAVIEVLDMLPDADGFGDDVDGLEVQNRLNEAFQRCDRLASRPADGVALDDVRQVLLVLEGMSAPFGFDESDWRRLTDAVAAAASESQLADRSRAKAAKAAAKLLRNYV